MSPSAPRQTPPSRHDAFLCIGPTPRPEHMCSQTPHPRPCPRSLSNSSGRVSAPPPPRSRLSGHPRSYKNPSRASPPPILPPRPHLGKNLPPVPSNFQIPSFFPNSGRRGISRRRVPLSLRLLAIHEAQSLLHLPRPSYEQSPSHSSVCLERRLAPPLSLITGSQHHETGHDTLPPCSASTPCIFPCNTNTTRTAPPPPPSSAAAALRASPSPTCLRPPRVVNTHRGELASSSSFFRSKPCRKWPTGAPERQLRRAQPKRRRHAASGRHPPRRRSPTPNEELEKEIQDPRLEGLSFEEGMKTSTPTRRTLNGQDLFLPARYSCKQVPSATDPETDTECTSDLINEV
ncbi:hypothetical protein EJB05_42096, partial [Eragrostis curvula]